MFKVECALRLGYTSTMFRPYSWNGMFCRKVTTLYEYLNNTCSIKQALNLQIEPSHIVDINFNRPKRGKDILLADVLPRKKHNIFPVCDEEEYAFFEGPRRVMPSSDMFSSVTKAQQLAPRSPVIRKFPAPLTSLQKPAGYAAMSRTELEEVCHVVFCSQLTITSEESLYLEESTRLQSLSPLWHRN